MVTMVTLVIFFIDNIKEGLSYWRVRVHLLCAREIEKEEEMISFSSLCSLLLAFGSIRHF